MYNIRFVVLKICLPNKRISFIIILLATPAWSRVEGATEGGEFLNGNTVLSAAHRY